MCGGGGAGGGGGGLNRFSFHCLMSVVERLIVATVVIICQGFVSSAVFISHTSRSNV